MRNLKQIFLAILVFTFVSACDKDEENQKENLEKATISAKWNVDNSSEYKSFEFNESGNYIVVKNTTTKSTNNQSVLFGTYEIIDDKTIVLSDFGTLTISEITKSSISFSVKQTSNPDEEIVMEASKQDEMNTTTKTELLCRTWKMVSINGEDVAGTENELSVLFSEAGTYFVEFVNSEFEDEYEDDGGIANWKWSDNSETKFLYSWETPPVWEEDAIVEVIELTSSSLKLLEIFDEGDGEEEELYVLVPSSNTKSAQMESNKSLNKQIKKGFLKK